jgi:hypothetical protein
MPVEPGANLGVLVRGVVIEMAMALHAAADDLAFKDVERGKQGRSAMPLVIMRHGRAAALPARQAGLGAVERLDLRFFVDRQDHRMRRRIDIKTDNVDFTKEYRHRRLP